jgi:hypothetical protein
MAFILNCYLICLPKAVILKGTYPTVAVTHTPAQHPWELDPGCGVQVASTALRVTGKLAGRRHCLPPWWFLPDFPPTTRFEGPQPLAWEGSGPEGAQQNGCQSQVSLPATLSARNTALPCAIFLPSLHWPPRPPADTPPRFCRQAGHGAIGPLHPGCSLHQGSLSHCSPRTTSRTRIPFDDSPSFGADGQQGGLSGGPVNLLCDSRFAGWPVSCLIRDPECGDFVLGTEPAYRKLSVNTERRSKSAKLSI